MLTDNYPGHWTRWELEPETGKRVAQLEMWERGSEQQKLERALAIAWEQMAGRMPYPPSSPPHP